MYDISNYDLGKEVYMWYPSKIWYKNERDNIWMSGHEDITRKLIEKVY